MEYKDLQKKNVAELKAMLAEARADVYDLRLKMSVNQLRTVRDIRKKRKDIARMSMQLEALERESK